MQPGGPTSVGNWKQRSVATLKFSGPRYSYSFGYLYHRSLVSCFTCRLHCDATFHRTVEDLRSLALFRELGIPPNMASAFATVALVLLSAFVGLVHSLASTDTITWGGDNSRTGYQT